MYFGIRHAAIQIYDGIDIPSSEGIRTYVMNRISLDKLTRSCGVWSLWIVWSYPILSCFVVGVMATEDTMDATQAHVNAEYDGSVMPDDFSTTIEGMSQL